jgi:hypothetical protein
MMSDQCRFPYPKKYLLCVTYKGDKHSQMYVSESKYREIREILDRYPDDKLSIEVSHE